MINPIYLSFDELLHKKSLLDKLFNKEVSEYLESLLNLEISALKKNTISDDLLKSLNELNFYRELVFYNLCMKSRSLIDNDSIKYSVCEDKYQDHFSNYNYQTIYFGIPNDGKATRHAILTRIMKDNDEQGNVNIELYNIVKLDYDEYINDYNKKINDLAEPDKILALKRATLTEEELQSKYNFENTKSLEQRRYLSLALQDMNLDLNEDFILDSKNNYVREFDKTKILVKTTN